jgi:hypothetical protein
MGTCAAWSGGDLMRHDRAVLLAAAMADGVEWAVLA